MDAAAYERFCLVLANIPVGKVCAYGQLASLAGIGGARQACRYLKALPKSSGLPWHRVVNAQGKLANFANADLQRQRLQDEGIVLTPSGRIPKHYYV